eukprot:105289_1
MSDQTNQPRKPSLLEPDLSGLSCTAWVKNEEESMMKIILGHIALFTFLFSWIFGYVLVIVFVFLFYAEYYTSATLLGSILFLPIFIRLPRSPAWCRLLMNGAYYFDGGCSRSYETFPYKDGDKPNHIPRKQMLCFHPHGLFTMGGVTNGGIRASAASDPSITQEERAKYVGEEAAHRTAFIRHAMVDPVLLNAPLFRPLMVHLAGCATSASKRPFLAWMKQGKSFGLVPGGFHDVMLYEQSIDCVYLREKKGFIKYALQFGYTVVAVYTFGECETYYNMCIAEETKKWMSDWRIPPVFWFHGEYVFCPFMPFRKIGLHTIMGQGIVCPQIHKPTQKDIDHYHQQYVKAVVGLFDRNKWRFGWEYKKLRVF